MAAPPPSPPQLTLLRLAVLAMGLYGLSWVLREAVQGRPNDPLVDSGLPASPLLRLDRSFAETEQERVARHLEANRPGSAELLAILREELPEDAVLIGFHADLSETRGEAEAWNRMSALAFLGHLQLLLHPIPVEPMPELGPGWTPPTGALLERLYVLDLGSPSLPLIEQLLERGPGTEAGTLWVPKERKP